MRKSPPHKPLQTSILSPVKWDKFVLNGPWDPAQQRCQDLEGYSEMLHFRSLALHSTRYEKLYIGQLFYRLLVRNHPVEVNHIVKVFRLRQIEHCPHSFISIGLHLHLRSVSMAWMHVLFLRWTSEHHIVRMRGRLFLTYLRWEFDIWWYSD